MLVFRDPAYWTLLLGPAEPSLIWLKMTWTFSIMLVLRLINVRKYDRMMKINFLNRTRLREETSVSRDRMQMLMPDFIVERISNFEISSTVQ